MRGGRQLRPGCDAGSLVGGSSHHADACPSLLEHRPAGIAEAGPLPAQAGGDGPDVRDFAGAKPVDVGRAGLFLFRRCGPS